MAELALTRDRTLSRELPAVNGHGGLILRPLPPLMLQTVYHCRLLLESGRKQHDIAEMYGLSDPLVHRLLQGQIAYSALAVEAVMGVQTQEVRLVVPVHPDDPPLPDLLALDVRLVPVEGGWQVGAPGHTLQAVAEMAGCSLRTVQRRVKDGTLPIVELVEGRPKSHRLARVPEGQALRAWVREYRSKHNAELLADEAQEGE